MIGTRTAGAFVASEIGRSGRERRTQTDRRQAITTVSIDRRITAERRLFLDRRLTAPFEPANLSPATAIDTHRRVLSAQVGRDVGEDVAALDYFLNVRPGAQPPSVLDAAELADMECRAMTDSLTGLFNRAFLDSALTRELARCRRRGVVTSLVLIDLDGFKGTNDRWGRHAGDAALCGVAGVIRRHLRAADAACRRGGDEFAIILPDTGRSGALLVAERVVGEVRRAFAARLIDGCPIAMTVSVGVAWYGTTCSTRAELLEAAELALRSARTGGGDRLAEAS
jgi:diguanylate cyclase (GGDEF)-like protein